jgi:hypothetical protein
LKDPHDKKQEQEAKVQAKPYKPNLQETTTQERDLEHV